MSIANVNGKIIVLISMMTLFVSACGDDVDVDYLGDSYTPTSHVDVYFSEDDVTEGYLVMGHATADGGDTEALQETLIEKARDRGADGIIFEGFDRVETGEQTIVNDIGDTSIVNTNTTSVLQVKAIFIKYNKNL
ncbi:hypothetical protein F4054_14950 [Candidatus Poribacteria bacterium]|nr:hypothetical protein [Candidatus Poribacteria bacterium]MYG07470.1 hypothetical protein [Candidatus Poribacteria bacterium]MYK23540.1 hypothetical protein [Candidatus Poribacteria bacterium]